MTTFTLQDLTPEQQVAVNNHEEMHKMFNEIGSVFVGEGKTANYGTTPLPNPPLPNPPQPTVTKEEWMEYGMNNPISTSAIDYATQHEAIKALEQYAPEPQPTLTDIINTICTQLQLLATVISSSATKPVEDNSSSNQSLQETVELVLKQSDWVKDMVVGAVDRLDIDDIVNDSVKDCVESEVETYFSHSFDPSDHFDFNDAVNDAVSEQIDDAVGDKIEEALDEYMRNATITISK